MAPHPFTIVNIFAERSLTGGDIAVIRRATDLPDECRREIAQETGPAAFAAALRSLEAFDPVGRAGDQRNAVNSERNGDAGLPG